MFDSLPLPVLLAIFAVAAATVWLAGIRLSDATDALDQRLGLGEALGGLILLAIATNLPEIAITVSAALAGNLGVAIGNILGGIAIQTVVLVLLDGIGVGRAGSLTYRAASLVLVLEGVLVMIVLTVAIMAAQLPARLTIGGIDPGGLAIAILWGTGLWLIGRARTDLPWHDGGDAPGGQEKRGTDHVQNPRQATQGGSGTARAGIVFAVAAAVTLIAGVVLERSSDAIATDIGMSGVLFAATVLAAATSLPEISTGLTSVRMGDYQLAFSDIFGGNAFLPVLFLLASLLSGTAVLPSAGASDLYLAGLGALLTAIYLYGLIFRPRRQVWRLGLDSWAVLACYAIGMLGLVAISRG